MKLQLGTWRAAAALLYFEHCQLGSVAAMRNDVLSSAAYQSLVSKYPFWCTSCLHRLVLHAVAAGNTLRLPKDDAESQQSPLIHTHDTGSNIQAMLLPLPHRQSLSCSRDVSKNETHEPVILSDMRGTGCHHERPAHPLSYLGAEVRPHDHESPATVAHGALPQGGLPSWILTAGDDAFVRCWDLLRPKASHTVLGLPPHGRRDVYDRVRAHPYPPQLRGLAEDSSGPSTASPKQSLHTPAGDRDAAAAGEGNLFPAFTSKDGLSLLPGIQARPVSDAAPMLIVSQSPATPKRSADGGGALPQHSEAELERKGLTPPPTKHMDSIVAMAWLEVGKRLLVTAGRDGSIKVWR